MNRKKFGAIDIMGAALLILLLLAFALCVRFGNPRGGVYQETLQARGIWLMAGGVAFTVAFFVIWLIRRKAIARHLLDAYGEECFKTIRQPLIKKEIKADGETLT